MAKKKRYGKGRTKAKRKSHHRKSAKRVAAGKKAWRTRKRRYGAAAARGHGKRTAKRHGGGHHRRRHGGGNVSRCLACKRTIFGGAKGMDTHHRRHHGGSHGGRVAPSTWLPGSHSRPKPAAHGHDTPYLRALRARLAQKKADDALWGGSVHSRAAMG